MTSPESIEHNELPWDERVTMLSINPDAATREDIANMAAELVEIWSRKPEAGDNPEDEWIALVREIVAKRNQVLSVASAAAKHARTSAKRTAASASPARCTRRSRSARTTAAGSTSAA